MSQAKEALLLLEDGTFYRGVAAGKIGTTGGEICFSTGMTGYQEIYTDPSYYGQIIVNTTSHIGNYGVQLGDEDESDGLKIKGMVCNVFSDIFSRHTADISLNEYFERSNIVAISNIDTRHLVRHMRQKGVMNAIISSEILDVEELKVKLGEIPSMAGLELSSIVSTEAPYFAGEEEGSEYRIAVMDYGIKKSILTNLVERGCFCKIFPAQTPAEEVLEWNPDGFFISNGPGDPEAMEYAVKTLERFLATDKPLFGICLGNQLLALASGIPTFKMHNGHRGLNHPVKNLLTGLCEVTSQNHGFAVSREAITEDSNVEITHINLNDNTVEGIRRKDKPAFSVQYHPEASPGPHDSVYLFDDFVNLLKAAKQ